MKAFIYTGGEIYPQNITEAPEEGDLVIAADSGYENALALGVTPSVLLGDFDSTKYDPSELKASGTEVITVPTEKDFTDTQLAVSTAIERGARQIFIIGGLSGRLDHTLSNLALLEGLYAKSIYAVICDGKNRVRYINSSSTLISRSGYKYFSVLARDKKLKGVCIEGGKYPLDNATLTCDYQYAVSNEVTGNCAFIAIKKGGAYIVESLDKL